MVLESIISPAGSQKHPRSNFVLGFIYASIAIVLAFFIFPSDPSLSVIFLTTLAALPLLINVLTVEEEEEMAELKIKNRLPLISSHFDVFMVFGYMFFGFLACYLTVYVFFPDNITQLLFSEQISTIQSIAGPKGFSVPKNGELTGQMFSTLSSVSGLAISAEEGLKLILLNNFKVLLFSLLFSFLYGAGAIFILAWNSSVLAVAMGNLIKMEIAKVGEVTGLAVISTYFQAGALSVLRYLIHGVPEVSAYFLGAVAGGIISAAVVRSDYRDSRFYEILIDSIDLIALASLLLIVAALIEVGITPLLVS